MNYRHIFHAGNICDVVKHAVLSLVLETMRAKDAAFCAIDTHAGIGVYDLDDPRAVKTGEAKAGVLKLLDAPHLPELEAYYAVLKKMNPQWDGASSEGFRYYPGSPLLTVHMLRPQDRLVACELHPEDGDELKRQMFPYRQAQVHKRDGYAALNAFLPPAEKRGFVLIDPPFEAPDEFTRLAENLKAAHEKWPQGILMAWYPIKERPAIWDFHEKLVAAGLPKTLAAEFVYQEEIDHQRLNGSGLILINAPWKIDDRLKGLFSGLTKALNTTYEGNSVNWLVQD